MFKDRGAIERSDASGPTAQLFNPLDNDAALVDQSQVVNKVVVVGKTFENFEIQLNDLGLGVDDGTVTADKFVIQRTAGGVTTTLTPDVDYTLQYETTSNVVLVTPAAGVWTNATYTINVNNSATDGIKDLAGNPLQPNNSSGATQFVIQLTDTATSSWQNPTNKYDVNGDGYVYPLDALIVINRILAGQAGQLPPTPIVPPYIDVSGDGILSPLDVLQVLNYLNAQAVAAVATPAVATPAVATPAVATPAVATPAVATPAVATPAVATPQAATFGSDTSTSSFVAATAVAMADVAATPVAEPPVDSTSASSAVAFSLSTQASSGNYEDATGNTIDVSSDSETAPVLLAASSSTNAAAMDNDVWGSDDWDSDDAWDEIAADLCEDSELAAALS